MTARRSLGVGLSAIVYLAVPALLVLMALPRFLAGLALIATQPVVVERIHTRPVATPLLSSAAKDFAAAMPSDGDSVVWRAELEALLAGNDPAKLAAARDTVIEGLKAEPANTRGWTLLCEIDAHLDAPAAAACMDTAFYVGPFDWFVSRRRSVLTSALWPQLDRDTQDAAARRIRTIWDTRIDGTPIMRNILFDVDKDKYGPMLLQAAFSGDPDELRAFNRWLIARWMYGVEPDWRAPP